MNKTEIMNGVTRSIHKFGFKFKKHSPEILVAAGVVGVVTSGVMACKATTKLSAILDETKENIDTIHKCSENPDVLPTGAEYTQEDAKKDISIVYVQTGVKLIKLYAPAVAVGALSIAAIVSSHNILRKRNVALAAAYTAVDRGFKDYRNRVVERFGKDLDRELRYNIKAKEIEETITDENGEEQTVTKTVQVADFNEHDIYTRVFDDGCTGWTKNADANRLFLQQQEDWANRKLKENGFLFLNEVYDVLGIPRTKAGQVVGWVYDPENPHVDSYVDFGLYDLHDKKKREFINGHERVVWLEFNVDGNVWELMK